MAVSSKFLVAALLSLNITAILAAVHQRTPDHECSQLPAPKVHGAEIISIKAEPRFDVPPNPILLLYYPDLVNATVDICDITVILTHPGVNDKVSVTVWLPLSGWNSRYQGAGGGGWTAGYPADFILFRNAFNGWATGITDGGLIADSNGVVGPQALSGPGQVNLGLLTDFAARGLHYVAVVGKALAASFYHQPPKFSYWTGCSTGGRQGYILAQKYPNDFDGIMANAPALSWPTFVTTLNWAHFVMNSAKVYPSHCEFSAFRNASIEACDHLDGVTDGIISDVANCNFDPFELVGKTIQCDGKPVKVSLGAALVVQKIREGPRSPTGQQLWDGYDYGIEYTGIAQTQVDGKGVPGYQPYTLPDDWVRWFLKKDPDFNFTSIRTLQQLTDLYAIGASEYSGIIGTDNPDLSAFRETGGKLLTYHGLADELIMANNTIRYRKAVEAVMGGKAPVDEFYRFFLAPGVAHCGAGYGPVPVDPIKVLVDWVEKGKAPDTLPASFKNKAGQTVTKNLCLYPLVARYKDKSDPNLADSYTCDASFI